MNIEVIPRKIRRKSALHDIARQLIEEEKLIDELLAAASDQPHHTQE